MDEGRTNALVPLRYERGRHHDFARTGQEAFAALSQSAYDNGVPFEVLWNELEDPSEMAAYLAVS